MQIDIERDSLVSLWRHLEKQPLTSDDRQRVEEVAIEIYAALQQPEQPKRGRPAGSRNKSKDGQLFGSSFIAPEPDDLTEKYKDSV